jgi:hypothetical protein
MTVKGGIYSAEKRMELFAAVQQADFRRIDHDGQL